jgi:hypothetical protein
MIQDARIILTPMFRALPLPARGERVGVRGRLRAVGVQLKCRSLIRRVNEF